MGLYITTRTTTRYTRWAAGMSALWEAAQISTRHARHTNAQVTHEQRRSPSIWRGGRRQSRTDAARR